MSFGRALHSAFWSAAPAALFHPKEGDTTIEGLRLTHRPSLAEPDEVKFAAMSDVRFYCRHLYAKLMPFLPEEFTVVAPPNGQNCFMHALDIDPSQAPFGRREFDRELQCRGYRCMPFAGNQPQKQDIIVYSVEGVIDSIREHAAVYVGNGRVQSRWGSNSPLLEHPYHQVVPTYWNSDPAFLSLERKR